MWPGSPYLAYEYENFAMFPKCRLLKTLNIIKIVSFIEEISGPENLHKPEFWFFSFLNNPWEATEEPVGEDTKDDI